MDAAPGYGAYCMVNDCKCAGNAWGAAKFVAYCDDIAICCCCCICNACNWCAVSCAVVVVCGWYGWNTGKPVFESAKAVRLFDSVALYRFCCACC